MRGVNLLVQAFRPRENMFMKPFTILTVVFLLLLAALQATRFFLGWEVNVNHVMVPVWVSGVATVVAAGLAAMVWREHQKT
jgi:hypothetical protein